MYLTSCSGVLHTVLQISGRISPPVIAVCTSAAAPPSPPPRTSATVPPPPSPRRRRVRVRLLLGRPQPPPLAVAAPAVFPSPLEAASPHLQLFTTVLVGPRRRLDRANSISADLVGATVAAVNLESLGSTYSATSKVGFFRHHPAPQFVCESKFVS